jgi:HEAT repeat protein
MGRFVILGAAFLACLFSGCSDSTDSAIQKLRSDAVATRVIAQDELIRRKDEPAVVKKVIGLLDDKDERTAFIAIQILGEMKDSAAVAPLGCLAENPNPAFRAEAVRSLGKIGIDTVWPVIEHALADSSQEVRGSAVTVLGTRNGLASLSKVYGMLRDPAPPVRAAAIQALFSLSALPEAGIRASDFQETVQDSFNVVRYVAAQALGKTYPDSANAVALLFSLLDDQDKSVQAEAVLSLGKIHAVRAVPILKKNFVFSPYEVQQAITKTIKALTGEEYPQLR